MDDFQKGLILIIIGMVVTFLGIPALILLGDAEAFYTLLIGVFVFVVGLSFIIYESFEKH